MSESVRDQEWKSLYAELQKSLLRFGTENAFGEADFWLVDDDYGDTTQKVCVHTLSFLRPEVILAVQNLLKQFPRWRVMVQLEMELQGVPADSSGLVIYSGSIEQHWDRDVFADLAKSLNL
jgi:hypothetical protein